MHSKNRNISTNLAYEAGVGIDQLLNIIKKDLMNILTILTKSEANQDYQERGIALMTIFII